MGVKEFGRRFGVLDWIDPAELRAGAFVLIAVAVDEVGEDGGLYDIVVKDGEMRYTDL